MNSVLGRSTPNRIYIQHYSSFINIEAFDPQIFIEKFPELPYELKTPSGQDAHSREKYYASFAGRAGTGNVPRHILCSINT
jgi:hypothetical protein